MSYNAPMGTRQKRLTELRGVFMLLTRLPMGGTAEDSGPLSDGVWALPLAGLVLGLAAAGVWGLASGLGVPDLAAALLALGTMTWLTCGLHEDGLADVADGFGGGTERPRKLAIMRDSRVGSYGVLALIFAIGLKAAALAPLANSSPTGAAVMIAAAVWSRTVIAVVLALLRPARSDGLGAAAGRPAGAVVLAGLLLGAAICGVVLSAGGGGIVIVALLGGGGGALGVAVLAQRQVGGYTGDVLGAVQQVAEIGVILAASAMIQRTLA